MNADGLLLCFDQTLLCTDNPDNAFDLIHVKPECGNPAEPTPCFYTNCTTISNQNCFLDSI